MARAAARRNATKCSHEKRNRFNGEEGASAVWSVQYRLFRLRCFLEITRFYPPHSASFGFDHVPHAGGAGCFTKEGNILPAAKVRDNLGLRILLPMKRAAGRLHPKSRRQSLDRSHKQRRRGSC